MPEHENNSPYYVECDLATARPVPTREPAPHQKQALGNLHRWYESTSGHNGQAGGILVLPTGAGKTFTAVHFLCSRPLSDRHKVLWLAHTHHLLEQALHAFCRGIGRVAEPREQINIRVVSGTTGHFPPAHIKRGDDVVICSLQTATRAVAKEHPALMAFLDAAAEGLFVVFDEAHHAPATTYRKLLDRIRQHCPRFTLLGLTATPTYSDEQKQGWLKRLFPQGIVAQADVNKLMANGVLARPVPVDVNTAAEPEFNQREYQQWMSGPHGDLPQTIINRLAKNHKRNDSIVAHYVDQQEKYGKTIMFADRWYQCEYLREGLRKRGVRADVMYSHVTTDAGRTTDDNADVLKRFRNDELDVLINVRMLTEGTDVPEVQTVFLTRQTTSHILLTQMVGRALRGPKFGGTPDAYIVSFIDDWKQLINWATPEELPTGRTSEGTPDYRPRPPLYLVSIELVRNLARQIDSGNIQRVAYSTLIPIGWYRVEYDTDSATNEDPEKDRTDDIQHVERLILVFEDQRARFEAFLKKLESDDLDAFESPHVRLSEVDGLLADWRDRLFESADDHIGADPLGDLLALALPLPQNFSLNFMKPLRYRGEHGDSESGWAQPAGQPHPTARGAGRGGIAGH